MDRKKSSVSYCGLSTVSRKTNYIISCFNIFTGLLRQNFQLFLAMTLMPKNTRNEEKKIMITKEEVQKIAKLARLKFEKDRVEEFCTKLSTIMNIIDILNEIDCKDNKPLTSVSNMNGRMRLDEVTSVDLSNELLQGSQAQLAKEVKYFITPKVVE